MFGFGTHFSKFKLHDGHIFLLVETLLNMLHTILLLLLGLFGVFLDLVPLVYHVNDDDQSNFIEA